MLKPMKSTAKRDKPMFDYILKKQIEHLRKSKRIWRFQARHGKYDFYKYLHGVLQLYWKWKESNILTADTKRRIEEMYKLDARKDRKLLNVIVDA